MEGFDIDGGSRLVVMELSHIKQLVAQLEVHLAESPDLCRRLASQILSLTERSIGIITSSPSFNGARKRPAADDAGLSSVPFIKTTKKRKLTEKRKSQVRVSSAGGGGPPVDDGHSWRKYGQKKILGAKHPRGYYRCSHCHSRGCAATKQVQRSDEDPALFHVFHLGTHTCVQQTATQAEPTNPDARGLLQGLSASLAAVETQALAAEPQGWPFPAPAASTSDNRGASPATSDSNHGVASLAPFDAAEWRAHSEHREVVSALVVASTPPVPSMDITDEEELLDIDISSFLATDEQYY